MSPKPSKAEQISAVSMEEAQEARNADHAVHHMIQVLEEEIVLGVLHPRERLVEDELMARFSTKRHVVRQAVTADFGSKSVRIAHPYPKLHHL